MLLPCGGFVVSVGGFLMTGYALLALGFVCGIDVRGGGDRCFGDGGVAELGVGRTCFGLSFYGSSPPYFLRFFVVRVCDPCCLKKTQPLRRSPEERLEKKKGVWYLSVRRYSVFGCFGYSCPLFAFSLSGVGEQAGIPT